MIRVALGIIALVGAASLLPPAVADDNASYGVLIISRQRLEVNTHCEIGVYLNDQLSARLFQEESTAFNLPPGPVDVRLRLLPGQAPGCGAGLANARSQRLTLSAGQISKYRIAMNQDGLYLRATALDY